MNRKRVPHKNYDVDLKQIIEKKLRVQKLKRKPDQPRMNGFVNRDEILEDEKRGIWARGEKASRWRINHANKEYKGGSAATGVRVGLAKTILRKLPYWMKGISNIHYRLSYYQLEL